jgi:hypothetical protein
LKKENPGRKKDARPFLRCMAWPSGEYVWFHRKTNSGLKPRPSGRCGGWNPGLKAGVSTVAIGKGMQTPCQWCWSDSAFRAVANFLLSFVDPVFPDSLEVVMFEIQPGFRKKVPAFLKKCRHP